MSFVQPPTPPDAVPVAHNTVIAGPATNVSPALPTARALVLADLPAGAVTAPGGSTNDIQVNVAGAFAGGRGTLDSSGNFGIAGDAAVGAMTIDHRGFIFGPHGSQISLFDLQASFYAASGINFQANNSGVISIFNLDNSGNSVQPGGSTAKHFIGNSTAPTVTAGAGAGTGGSPAASLTGTDAGGVITVTTGTIAATGVVATITFNVAYGSAPFVVITPANAATALLSGVTMVYVTAGTATFVINSGSTGITAGGAVYAWNFNVIG